MRIKFSAQRTLKYLMKTKFSAQRITFTRNPINQNSHSSSTKGKPLTQIQNPFSSQTISTTLLHRENSTNWMPNPNQPKQIKNPHNFINKIQQHKPQDQTLNSLIQYTHFSTNQEWKIFSILFLSFKKFSHSRTQPTIFQNFHHPNSAQIWLLHQQIRQWRYR